MDTYIQRLLLYGVVAFEAGVLLVLFLFNKDIIMHPAWGFIVGACMGCTSICVANLMESKEY